MKTKRKGLTLAAVASLTVLAGCGNPILSTSSQDVVFKSGVLSTFSYAAAPGEMRTVIVGNPFGAPRTELDQIVTTAMEGNHFGPLTTFTTDPSEAAHPSYRIVMLFDPPPAMDRDQLCAPPAQLSAGQPEPTRLGLTTGFCAQNELMSWVASSMARPSSASDPAFSEMVADAMWNLIPSRDRERERNRFVP